MLFLRLLAHALALAGLRGVGVILVDAEGRFLLNLRGRRSDKPGIAQLPGRTLLARRWAILGGIIDPGEPPERAALREVEEETGQRPRRLHPVVRAGWPRPVHLYAGGISVRAEDVLLGEGVEHRLVALEDVSTLPRRAPLLPQVLRAFAATDVYRACLEDARSP